MAAKKSAKRTAKKAAAPKAVKLGNASKPRTKSEVYSILSESAGISRKEVAAVFDGITQILTKDLGKGGPGAVNLGGLMKVTVQRKPATKARKGINPFTKEPTIFKAKPARNVIKVRPMKALKSVV
ncbi:MAG: HU family DNA-binding protein [Phycisphaeraceae bacterium]|nr:HU family DNA-binding protein [Phycisphaeraceae bacterium]